MSRPNATAAADVAGGASLLTARAGVYACPGMNGAILLLLGVVFAAAAPAKFASPQPFRATIRKLYGPRAAGPMSVAIPVVELLLGGWLISGASPQKAAAVAVVV